MGGRTRQGCNGENQVQNDGQSLTGPLTNQIGQAPISEYLSKYNHYT